MIIDYVCAVDIANYDAQRTHIIEVVAELRKAGARVTLLLPAFRNSRETFPFPVCYIPVLLKRSKLKFLEYELRLFWVLLIRCLRRRPEIIYLRKGFITLAPLLVARLLRIPSLTEVNGIIADEVRVGFGLGEGPVRFFALVEKYCYRLSSGLVAVTGGLKRYLTERYGIAPGRITVIPNGVNTERFVPASPSAVERSAVCLGFVGHLVPWAGVEYLIQALPLIVRKMPGVRALIIGDGQQLQALVALAKSLDMAEWVEFTGQVSPAAVPEYINRCDICFVPAIRQRNAKIGGSSLKLYEYLACGKPVIVSDIPGLDIVGPLAVGRVVTPEDAGALAEAVIDLALDPALRRVMSRRARQAALERFSWRNTATQILACCRDIA